jgi:hypothetical protein
MDVKITLDDGTGAIVSWAMDGLVEGIDLKIQPKSDGLLEIDEVDVTASDEWRNLVDRVIEQVAVGWHIPNEGCPNTLWCVRLSLSKGAMVAVALGQLDHDIVQYQPDELVVLFDEAAARAYHPPASTDSAFGTAIEIRGAATF